VNADRNASRPHGIDISSLLSSGAQMQDEALARREPPAVLLTHDHDETSLAIHIDRCRKESSRLLDEARDEAKYMAGDWTAFKLKILQRLFAQPFDEALLPQLIDYEALIERAEQEGGLYFIRRLAEARLPIAEWHNQVPLSILLRSGLAAALEEVGEIQLALAVVQTAIGQLPISNQEYEAIAERVPRLRVANLYARCGSIHTRTGTWNKANEEFNVSILLGGSQSISLTGLAELRLRQGKLNEAKHVCYQAVKTAATQISRCLAYLKLADVWAESPDLFAYDTEFSPEQLLETLYDCAVGLGTRWLCEVEIGRAQVYRGQSATEDAVHSFEKADLYEVHMFERHLRLPSTIRLRRVRLLGEAEASLGRFTLAGRYLRESLNEYLSQDEDPYEIALTLRSAALCMVAEKHESIDWRAVGYLKLSAQILSALGATSQLALTEQALRDIHCDENQSVPAIITDVSILAPYKTYDNYAERTIVEMLRSTKSTLVIVNGIMYNLNEYIRLLEIMESDHYEEHRIITDEERYAESLLEKGVHVSVIPKGVNEGMYYVTPKALVESRIVKYSHAHINLLAREGDIPSFHIAGQVVLPLNAVETLISRQSEAERNPRVGRPPGPSA
jgi:tetratricopeptide (TPR) repeat protein